MRNLIQSQIHLNSKITDFKISKRKKLNSLQKASIVQNFKQHDFCESIVENPQIRICLRWINRQIQNAVDRYKKITKYLLT